MELLRKMLKNREENQANILAKRLDRLWVKKQKEKDAKLKELRKENIKCELSVRWPRTRHSLCSSSVFFC